MIINCICRGMKSHFHMNGFALGLGFASATSEMTNFISSAKYKLCLCPNQVNQYREIYNGVA